MYTHATFTPIERTSYMPDVTSAIDGESNSGVWQKMVVKAVIVYAVPLLSAFGLVGNVLMFLIMQRGQQRRSPVSVYMSALAVTDCLVLIFDFLNNWFKVQLKLYVLRHSTEFCRFYRFIFNVCYTYSAWLVTALAVERFIVIWFPLKAKSLCSYKKAMWTILGLAICILAFCVYNVWGWHLNESGQCSVVPEMSHFLNNIAPWLSAAFYAYIPVIILIICTAGIVLQIWKARSKRMAMSEGNTNVQSGKMNDEVLRVTISVVTIVIAFLILSVPLTAFYIIVFATGEFLDPTPTTELVEAIVLALGLSNHSVNFFLYVMTSANFRLQLKLLFGFKPPCSSTSGMMTATTSMHSELSEKSHSTTF